MNNYYSVGMLIYSVVAISYNVSRKMSVFTYLCSDIFYVAFFSLYLFFSATALLLIKLLVSGNSTGTYFRWLVFRHAVFYRLNWFLAYFNATQCTYLRNLSLEFTYSSSILCYKTHQVAVKVVVQSQYFQKKTSRFRSCF